MLPRPDSNLSAWMCCGIVFLLWPLIAVVALAGQQVYPDEKSIKAFLASEAFSAYWADRRCGDRSAYRVYLIDNFEQQVDRVPEVETSHGELLLRILRGGRDDIDLRVLNTSLSRGLAQVIHALRQGACVDTVVSSIPGSNYTYDQISSLFGYRVQIASENFLMCG